MPVQEKSEIVHLKLQDYDLPLVVKLLGEKAIEVAESDGETDSRVLDSTGIRLLERYTKELLGVVASRTAFLNLLSPYHRKADGTLDPKLPPKTPSRNTLKAVALLTQRWEIRHNGQRIAFKDEGEALNLHVQTYDRIRDSITPPINKKIEKLLTMISGLNESQIDQIFKMIGQKKIDPVGDRLSFLYKQPIEDQREVALNLNLELRSILGAKKLTPAHAAELGVPVEVVDAIATNTLPPVEKMKILLTKIVDIAPDQFQGIEFLLDTVGIPEVRIARSVLDLALSCMTSEDLDPSDESDIDTFLANCPIADKLKPVLNLVKLAIVDKKAIPQDGFSIVSAVIGSYGIKLNVQDLMQIEKRELDFYVRTHPGVAD